MNENLGNLETKEIPELKLTPEELEIIEGEITRREEVLHNIVKASLNNEPATVYRHFDEEIKHRLSEMLNDYKVDLAKNLIQNSSDENEDDELTNEEMKFIDDVANLTEEELNDLMNDPEIDDDEKALLIQIIEALNEEDNSEE